MAAAIAPSGRKLLCLHGFMGCAEVFRSRTGALRSKALKGLKCDFEFVDAPHLASLTYIAVADGASHQSPAQRAWFNPAEDDLAVRPVDSTSWSGWQSSLDHLKRVVEASDEWVGVLGFSQGAAVAALLVALYPAKFRFCVLISGFTPQDDSVGSLYAGQGSIHVPSLHVMGTSDPFVSIARAELLASKFHNPKVLVHEEGHVMPPKELYNAVKEFCLDFQ